MSFFDEKGFCPVPPTDDENWCGGVHDTMFAIDNNGFLYHCIRFMDSSLQGDQKAFPIGDIKTGLGITDEHKENLATFRQVTRRSQSTDECFYCPVAQGCGWCSGYNYQVTGSVDKRVTFICPMHKARSLANVYFWNKLYKKEDIDKIFPRYLSDEESLKIISHSEIDLLNSLERR